MKKEIKKIFGFVFLIIIVSVSLQLTGFAETSVVESETAIQKADAFLSGDTLRNLWVDFTDSIKVSVKGFSSVFAIMLFVTFMLGIMRLMTANNSAIYAGEICLCAVSFSVVSTVCDNGVRFLENIESFMLAALPVMTTLYTVSSAPSTATVNYATSLIYLNICNAVFTTIIIPGIKCITVFAVMSFISKSFDFSGFTYFLKNTVGWLFGILMCIMSAVVAFQNVISNAKDGIMGRTVRFAASRFIPVLGTTVSESARTVAESLRLVRSVSGVAGIFAIIGIIASPVAAFLVCRFFINICCACARLFSCQKAAVFLGELSGVMNLLLGVTVGISLIFIIILGIFAKMSIAV